MKPIFLLIFLVPLKVFSQTPFWTENFGTGCNQGQLINGYVSPNGNWSVTNTGSNASSSNVWYVSAMENGNAAGSCGSVCGDDRSLHVGNVFVLGIGADQGAAYYEGIAAFCGIFPCGATDKRAQSPIINCTGQTGITLEFDYIEGGNTQDNATLWYFNGGSWSLLADMDKTFSGICSPQGIWTHYSIALPASADNNSQVRIGFRWINNEDGNATDPSLAVDDIQLIAVPQGDTVPPTVECPTDETISFDETCTASVPDYISGLVYSDNEDPAPVVIQSPLAGTTFTGTQQVTITVTDASANMTICTFSLEAIDIVAPEISCTEIIQTFAGLEPGMVVAVEVLNASDDCSSYIINNSLGGGADATGYYPVGMTEVVFTATDSFGNNASCSTLVDVQQCCEADFNCDGTIGVSDLLFLIGFMGTTCEFGCPADLNGDFIVGVTDQLEFLGVFGTFCP
jgi:hypothetical protein